LHLKRFYFSAFAREKINTPVTVPLAGFNVDAHVIGPDAGAGLCTYDLFAVSQHSGVLDGGHCAF
jgi:hypothetical protein